MGNTVYAEPTSEVVVIVRLHAGVVGERNRVCHLVPVLASGPLPHELAALCGEPIVPGNAEVMNEIRGMPCEACLTRFTRSARRLLPRLR